MKKNKCKSIVNGNIFRVIGVNAAGIASKIESFDKMLFDRKPSVWFLQETKRKPTDTNIKSNNLVNYQVFEMKRTKTKKEGGKGFNGGGLAVGALHDLNPVLISHGSDEAECMTIEVTTGMTRVRCITGYGPQESDIISRKYKFWNYLEKEVHSASSEDVGIIIEMDSNAWAGNEIIPNDPNKQNSNGHMLEMFLKRNKNLTIINSLPICEGTITRKRKTLCLNEESILDLFIVCDKVLPNVIKMQVDEQGVNQLTNYYGTTHNKKPTETDHSKVELDIDWKFKIQKPQRIEAYNYRSQECQKYFKNITSNTTAISSCLESKEPFQKQIKKWEHTLKSHVIAAFPKIRSRKRKFTESDIGKLLETRKQMKLDTSNDRSDEIAQVEAEIGNRISISYIKKIQETMGHLVGDDGGVSHHGVWKARNSLISNDKQHNPVALKDKAGNTISNPEGIKKICLEEILERVRHRKIHPRLRDLQHLKEELCAKRLNIAAHRKSAPWTMQHLERVLKLLKRRKCRDPQGYLNELFKYEAAGSDLKKSLLHIMNKTKEQLEIPDMMKDVNVVLIPKQNKANSNLLENQRGIFLLSIYRSILMKMLLLDEYEGIDEFMSDSNAGGRKGRRAQDHLFIINGIIHQHATSKSEKQISISIYDCEQCFDSLWQEDVVNDLYEAGVKNDKLALLYKANEANNIAVKTPNGISERKTVKNITCQGEPWGPIDCSLQVDGIGKESLNPSLEPYSYKGEVEIPALGWLDDIITVSESGHKTSRMNSFINAQLATKKLRLGAKKCFVLHVGSEHENFKNIELVIDGWTVKSVESYDNGEKEWEDTLEEDMKEISHINYERYLGQIISSDSSNIHNITKQRNKGIGIQNKIIQMLDKIPGGSYHFETAVILRNALLISSMISNSEVWYGLTKKDTDMLEQVDEMWMSNLFECSRNVPRDLLYLELGIVPISYLIKARKQMYLHHILQQEEDSLLHRFFTAQMKFPVKNDWISQVLEEQEELDINNSLIEIQSMTKSKFKALVQKKIKQKAFEHLKRKK